MIRGEEVDRFELQLGEHRGETYGGYLRVGETLAPLPIGSQLNGATGRFTWAPGVGFVGTYDLVFVRWTGAQAVARQDVRVILAAKGSGHTGTQVVIDTPRSAAGRAAAVHARAAGRRISTRPTAPASTRCTSGPTR